MPTAQPLETSQGQSVFRRIVRDAFLFAIFFLSQSQAGLPRRLLICLISIHNCTLVAACGDQVCSHSLYTFLPERGRTSVAWVLIACACVFSCDDFGCCSNPVDLNIFATTSVDRTCCLWDLRLLRAAGKSHGGGASGKEAVCQPLLSQTFNGAVSAATFSSNGQRLLVTSQDNCVRVCQVSIDGKGAYLVRGSQPGWGEQFLQVTHPHRFYQVPLSLP